MKKDMVKNVIIAFLAGVLALSVLKYISALQEKFELLQNLTKAREEVAALEDQKQNLLADLGKEKEVNAQLNKKNVELKDYLQAGIHRIERAFKDARRAQALLDDASSKIALLKGEKEALILRKDLLTQENEALRLKLSSVEELKKAIRDLKRKQETDLIPPEGNKGFLIKDGQTNTPAKVKIEVVPAPASQSK
jgi:hypothetical protein